MDQTGAASPISTAGLVGWWRLDETGGNIASDSSGHGHHGRVVGIEWGEHAGRRAAFFDGSGGARIDVAHTKALEIVDDITIAAWLWRERANQASRWDAVLSKTPGIWDYELLTSMARSDEPAFFSPESRPSEVYAGEPVAARTWVHVAVSRRGSTVSFFIDGQTSDQTEMTGRFTRSGGALQIGHDAETSNGGMHGWLCDVVLFDRALGLDEIGGLLGQST